jgi:hypothetical protein
MDCAARRQYDVPAMGRTAIDTLARMLEAAYRGDPFHALRRNLDSVLPEEWEARPPDAPTPTVEPATDVFAISEIVLHVAGAKFMYANHAFGDAALEWSGINLPATRDRDGLLTWLDEGHSAFAAGLAAADNDAVLEEKRPWPGGFQLPVSFMIATIINHDLYHSGEINRQRALLRHSGWR